MSSIKATATFNDVWFGEVPAHLVSFKTSRGGVAVVRYRWRAQKGGTSCGFASGGFPSVARAIAAALSHARFSNIETI
jgi:hypothetical protein